MFLCSVNLFRKDTPSHFDDVSISIYIEPATGFVEAFFLNQKHKLLPSKQVGQLFLSIVDIVRTYYYRSYVKSK